MARISIGFISSLNNYHNSIPLIHALWADSQRTLLNIVYLTVSHEYMPCGQICSVRCPIMYKICNYS